MGKKWPLISVCILSFNRLDYLEKTLDSFRDACTYPNLEYIVVDNGSVPEVVEYLKSLLFIDKMIFNKENMGLGFALNQARHAAAGDYFFNLENDWLFFYKSDWMEKGVLMFEKDERGEHVHKKPENFPLGLVKYKVGAGVGNYTNNPSLMSRSAYEAVGEFSQFGREYKYVSEDVHRSEPHYIKRLKKKYSCAKSETPCAVHIGGFTTNPNYRSRGRRRFEELDELLKNRWKKGKWNITYNYMMLGNRWKIRKALKQYKEILRKNKN
ncbi:MAG TPA: glycosyltransferase family 2 protein [bacterium]|nr:glycosyltransferase family 2 protein [bacterium]